MLAGGALSVVARLPPAWWLALATTLLAVLGVALGLSLTVRGGRTGDIVYHVCLLLLLLATAGVLLVRETRRTLAAS